MNNRRTVGVVASLVAACLFVVGCSVTTGGVQDTSVVTPNETEVFLSVPAPTVNRSQLVPQDASFEPYRGDGRPATDDFYRLDENGLTYWERDGVRYHHPVVTAQAGIQLMNHYLATNDDHHLDLAIIQAEGLLADAVEHDGAIFFPYPFDFALHGDADNTIGAPWYSAMAQGQGLSLFVRLYGATGEQRWMDAADQAFSAMTQVHGSDDLGPQPWVTFVDPDGWLWLEEYAGDVAPMRVLNGHIFAMFGVYEYWQATGSKPAARLFDAAATTVVHHVPLLRNPGQASWYGMRVQDNPIAMSESYHRIHIVQLRALADITLDPVFDVLADTLESDFS